MKKLLTILGTLSLVVSSSTTIVACTTQKEAAQELGGVISQEHRSLGQLDDLGPNNNNILQILGSKIKGLKTNDLEVVDLQFDDQDFTKGTASIAPKSDSKKYVGKVKVNFTAPQLSAELQNLAVQQAQSLTVVQNYGFDHQLTSELMSSKTMSEESFKVFSEQSVNKITASKSLGIKGGIFDLLLPADFKIDSKMFDSMDESMKGLLENVLFGQSKDGFDDLKGSNQLSIVIDNVLKYLQILNFDVVMLLPLIIGQVSGIELNETMATAIGKATDGVKDFLSNTLSKETVLPILQALKTGTDLTVFENLSVENLYSVAIFSLINVIGYGTDDGDTKKEDYQKYQEINLLTQATKSGKYNDPAAALAKIIKNDSIKNFDFNNNPAKILENLLTTVSVFNLILSVYRTDSVDFNKPLLPDQNRSDYLFSNEQNNGDYVYQVSQTIVKDLNLNLNGLNLGEMIANLNYYLGSGTKYPVQKLFYIFLLQGQGPSGSYKPAPLANFLTVFMGTFFGLSGYLVTILTNLMVSYLIAPLANNSKLGLDGIFGSALIGDYIEKELDKMLPGKGKEVRKAILEINELIGPNAFDFLYDNDLRQIIDKLKPFLEEKDYQMVKEGVDKLFEDNKANLNNLLNQVPLKNFLKVFNVAGFENPNIPHHGSYYTSQSIKQLINHLATIFEIRPTTKLTHHYLDFSLFETMANELLYEANDQDSGLIIQIMNSLVKNKNMSEVFSLLGYDEKLKVFQEDSFLGRLLVFLAPELKTKINNNTKTFTINNLRGLHNNLQWVLKAANKLLPNLTKKEDIATFVSQLIKSDKTFKTTVVRANAFQATLVVEFDKNFVVFDDGSVLGTEKLTHYFKINRWSIQDKFDITFE